MGKRVVHIVLRDYIDSYSYQENLLSQKHREMGFDVAVITSQLFRNKDKQKSFHEVGNFINDYGIKVYVLPCKAKDNFQSIFYDQAYGLYQTLEEYHPDIIFMHNFAYNDVRHVVRYAKANMHVRVYADCHTDYYNSAYNTLYGRLKALFARRQGHKLNKVAIRFWGTTPWRVDFLKNVYKLPPDKVALLIMGADEMRIENINRQEVRMNIRKQYQIPSSAFLVITGGKLDIRKQQHLLMEAVCQLEKENIWLIVFGTPTEEMKDIVSHYKGIRNIIMAGWKKAEETYSLFMASDLAFFPGTHSVLWEEAVACSTPIVIKHWSGMEHVNVDGNALLLDDVRVGTITETLKSLNRTQKYNAMLAKAERCASSFYLRDIALKAIGEDKHISTTGIENETI